MTMRQLGQIPVSQIKMDRYPFQRILGLVNHLATGHSVPPIHVKILRNGQYQILDGRHRVMAFKLLGRETILARFNKDARKA